MSEWVTLRPILEVYDRATGYEGGGRRREPWWRQTTAWMNLSATLEYISAEKRARCWESGRRDKGGGGREVSESDAGRYGPWYARTEIRDTSLGK